MNMIDEIVRQFAADDILAKCARRISNIGGRNLKYPLVALDYYEK
jgi:hypothetical protein